MFSGVVNKNDDIVQIGVVYTRARSHVAVNAGPAPVHRLSAHLHHSGGQSS